jgi:high-affinity nickel-transport protein
MGGMTLAVIGLNVVGWGLLAQAVGHHYRLAGNNLFGLGTGVLAYTLGMRHAFDADHIAAIDNTTRKLMQDGKRPVGVGFFFSLGHSTVVVLLSVFVALSAAFVKTNLPTLQSFGGIVGTSISGVTSFRRGDAP